LQSRGVTIKVLNTILVTIATINMRHLASVLLVLHSVIFCSQGLEIISISPDVIVKQGEDATLSCEGDMEWDTCTWHLPTGARCGPLTTTQTSCRSAGAAGQNILFTGTETNCQIKINSVKNEQSGDWVCSLELDGTSVNSSSTKIIEAQPANVDWEVVYGSMEIRSEEPHPSITCKATHSRPAGEFRWYLGEDRASPLNNTSPVYNQPDGHGFVEATQQYTFEPRPELDGQYLYCVYQQEDGEGRELYTSEVNIELVSHYLAVSEATPLVEAAQTGQDLDISIKFEAQPRPNYGDMVWHIVKSENHEVNIPIMENNYNDVQYYSAHPLRQLSQYEYEATLTIKNVSSVENGFEHFLYMTTSINPNSAELVFNHKLDVQVDVFELPDPEPQDYTVTIVVVIVLLVLIIIVAVSLTLHAKNNSKWCFSSGGNEGVDATDQKEPLQVQHHPYARPSS